jgi:transposase, IS5 family
VQNTLFSFDSPIFPEWHFFKNSTELGRIFNLIPWDELVKLLPEKKNPASAPSYLPRAGYFGLMFLKHYTSLSDEKLLAAFQTNYAYQMFCVCRLKVGEVIRDNAFVSRTRSYLAKHCDMNKVQEVLIEAFKGKLENTNVLMMDATCYEVHLRFPTDVKLLWESCTFLWEEQIPGLCKLSGQKTPRSKFKEQKIKQIDFSKKRKVGIKANKKRVKSLLKLLKKGIEAFQNLLDQTKGLHLSENVANKFKTIRKVYQQQRYLVENKTTSVKDRIVSLSQPHIRPIVRGKENKPVEFGIKAHIMQVGGLNIIEYHSFNAFNETTRLKHAYFKHRSMIGTCTHLAADGIYPTNSNRRFCTTKKLQTNFVAKGKKVTDKNIKKVKTILSIERGTRLEGSFGTEKENYGLRKIRAKTSETQIVWMFFGIFTANVVRLSKRQKNKHKKAA